MSKKNKINELNMDLVTYKKVKGTLSPDDKKNITITGDKTTPSQPSQSTSNSTSMVSQMEESEAIQPQDQETIKYLSNVKDENGQISKPFTIGTKKYQMVRGTNSTNEVVLGVYCHDVNESGENIIHSVDYFEENIAKKAIQEYEDFGDEEGPQPGDSEYHNPKQGKRKEYSNFNDIDWQILYDTLVANGEYLENKQNGIGGINGNPNYGGFNDSDLTDSHEGLLTKGDLEKLEYNDLIGEYGHMPYIGVETYRDYGSFKAAAQAIWGTDIDTQPQSRRNSEEPYLRGREDVQETDSLNLSKFKHYIVNEKSGKFRKYQNISELASAVMGEGEKYMGIKEFKRYFEGKVFGGNKKNMLEDDTQGGITGIEDDEEMNLKAKKLMMLIQKRIPSNIINTIKTPVAKREVIAAFAEIIGVPRPSLAVLISGLKDLSKAPQQPTQAPVTETKILSKKEIEESVSKGKLARIVKVKDIK